MTIQVVDPEVSRAKFEREVADLRALEANYRRRGWWIMETAFPIVQVAFVTPNSQLQMVTLTARMDFTNYDLEPPSVQFINAFTGQILNFEQLHSHMPRLDLSNGAAVTMWQMGQAPAPVVNLIQGFPGTPGFICLPGTREYHENPAHTGDSWFLHRDHGAGCLHNILDKISRYGSEPITQLAIQVGARPGQVSFPE